MVNLAGLNPLAFNIPVQSPVRKLPFDLADYDNILGDSYSSDDEDSKMR